MKKLNGALFLFNLSCYALSAELAESANSEWVSQLRAEGRVPTWVTESERAAKAVAKALQEVFPGSEPLSGAKPFKTPPLLNNSFLSEKQKAMKAMHIAYVSREEARRYCRSLDRFEPPRPDHMDMRFAKLISGNLFKLKQRPKR